MSSVGGDGAAPAAGSGQPARPIEIDSRSADETREVGRRLAELLRAGDIVVLGGDLGAGKTTFAQGVGARLGIRGDVTSPTFVISRIHPSVVGGPALVHVDAYRIHGGAELDDLDLDDTLEDAVTLVEWGDGLAEALAADRLRVHLARRRGDIADPPGTTGAGPDGDAAGPDSDAAGLDGDEPRTITVEATGARWDGVPLRQALAGSPDSCW